MGYNGPQQQMKKTLLFAVAMFVATFSFAQQQLATLNHNDSITVYYGATAFQQAYAAAIDGDIITLSSGSFSALDISKAITIRGAGMYVDTVSGTAPTIINGDFKILQFGSLSSHLRFEGIRFVEKIVFRIVNYPEFIKCELYSIECSYRENPNEGVNYATFSNCIIENLVIGGRKNTSTVYANYYYTHFKNSVFNNSVILSYLFNANSYSNYIDNSSDANLNGYGTNNSFTNCIIKMHPNVARNYSTSNCVLFYSDSTLPSSSSLAYNTIGLNVSGGDANYFDPSILDGQNLHNYGSFSSVFKTFNGTYTSGGTSFELQDSIATSILGTDGTQVGIYGGAMPFNPYVRHPLVRRSNVASRSTADGKLAVDIEIVTE